MSTDNYRRRLKRLERARVASLYHNPTRYRACDRAYLRLRGALS